MNIAALVAVTMVLGMALAPVMVSWEGSDAQPSYGVTVRYVDPEGQVLGTEHLGFFVQGTHTVSVGLEGYMCQPTVGFTIVGSDLTVDVECYLILGSSFGSDGFVAVDPAMSMPPEEINPLWYVPMLVALVGSIAVITVGSASGAMGRPGIRRWFFTSLGFCGECTQVRGIRDDGCICYRHAGISAHVLRWIALSMV